MEKRVFFAVALSVLVLISWQFYASKAYHIDTKEVMLDNQVASLAASSAGSSNTASFSSEPVSVAPQALLQQESIPLDVLEGQNVKLSLINPGARIGVAYLRNYNVNFNVNGGLESRLYADKNYTFQRIETGEVKLSFGQNGHFVHRKMSSVDKNYMSNLEITYENTTSAAWIFSDQLVLNKVSLKSDPAVSNFYEVFFLNPPNTIRKNPAHLKNRLEQKNVGNGLGFRDQYACIIVKDKGSALPGTYFVDRQGEFSTIGIDLQNINVSPGSRVTYKYAVYIGPQDVGILKKSGEGFEEAVNYGTFDFISGLLLSLLRFFHAIFRNWGVALIALSVAVFLMLYPLTLKQMHAMKQMQILQPKIEALRKTYKDNPQKLNKEVLELYREHKANPLGGCLPMILQIPIFFGLYQALSRSIELKGASFLWIKDLSEGDRLFTFPSEVLFLGRDFNILPILMAGAMFFQQKISMKTSAAVSPEAAQQQKMMLMIMPVMFGVIFYKAPSGLALYWFINSLLSVLSQWKLLKPVNVKAVQV